MTKLQAAFSAIIIFISSFFSKSVSLTDKNAIKIIDTTADDRFPHNFYTSKEYDYTMIKKCYKQYPNMTFNDLVVSIFSKSCHQLYKEYGIENANQLSIFIIINLRSLPTSYDDVCLDNSIVTPSLQAPILNDIDSIYKLIKPKLNIFKTLKTSYTFYYLYTLILFVFSEEAILKMFKKDKIDSHTYISNVSLSDVPWKINGKEIRNISINHTNFYGIYSGLIIYTYNSKVRFGMQNVNNLRLDLSKLFNNIVHNFEQEIAKVDKM